MFHFKIELVKLIISKLKGRFGKMLSACYALDYDFLGIKIFFTNDKRACVDRREYLIKATELFREDKLKKSSCTC